MIPIPIPGQIKGLDSKSNTSFDLTPPPSSELVESLTLSAQFHEFNSKFDFRQKKRNYFDSGTVHDWIELQYSTNMYEYNMLLFQQDLVNGNNISTIQP